MSDLKSAFEFGQSHVEPGQLILEESFRGKEDHQEYEKFERLEGGEIVRFWRPKIMKEWTDRPLISDGFTTCYPLISINPEVAIAQAVHVSLDPWFLTDREVLWKRIDQWNAERDRLLLVTAERSAIYDNEINKLKAKFGNRFVHIPLGLDSRFGVVYDTQHSLLLVQLTDAKLLRVYQGFRK